MVVGAVNFAEGIVGNDRLVAAAGASPPALPLFELPPHPANITNALLKNNRTAICCTVVLDLLPLSICSHCSLMLNTGFTVGQEFLGATGV